MAAVLICTKTMIRRDGVWSLLPVPAEGITKALVNQADTVTDEEMPTRHDGRALLRAGYEHTMTPTIQDAARFAIEHRAGSVFHKADPPPEREHTQMVVPSINTVRAEVAVLTAEVAELRAELAEMRAAMPRRRSAAVEAV